MSTRRRRTNSGREQSEEVNGYTYSNCSTYSTTHLDNFSSDIHTPSSFITDSTMTCRDRTNEFLSAVKSMQSRRLVCVLCMYIYNYIICVCCAGGEWVCYIILSRHSSILLLLTTNLITDLIDFPGKWHCAYKQQTPGFKSKK